jgi:hypothetical protein
MPTNSSGIKQMSGGRPMYKCAEKLIEEYGWEKGTAIEHCRAKGICEYCGDDLLASVKDYYSMQIDHLLPKSLHIDHESDYANYVSCCSTCNHLKGRFNPLEDDEDAKNMLAELRSDLVERVRNYLITRYATRTAEFQAVKNIIRPNIKR